MLPPTDGEVEVAFNQGGPAFHTDPQSYVDGWGGMSLRDWFAGKIIGGWCANPKQEWDEDELDFIAKEAYRLADAMLKEREK